MIPTPPRSIAPLPLVRSVSRSVSLSRQAESSAYRLVCFTGNAFLLRDDIEADFPTLSPAVAWSENIARIGWGGPPVALPDEPRHRKSLLPVPESEGDGTQAENPGTRMAAGARDTIPRAGAALASFARGEMRRLWHDPRRMSILRFSTLNVASRVFRGRRLASSLNAMTETDRIVKQWEKDGRPIPPPPEVKQQVLRAHARQYGLRTFVETGTFFGDTTAALEPYLDELVTIEISPDLASRARERFAGKSNVRVLEGDSGGLLPEILGKLRTPALFWLDGHFSGGITARGDEDTPVRTELRAILDHPLKTHVILIDDARDFKGGEYPSLAEVEGLVHSRGSDYDFVVRDDVIRLTPRRQET
jgi:hypothetical protein